MHKFNGADDARGTFGIAHLGADYLASPNLLIGAAVQYDNTREKSTDFNYTVQGKGWMADPYATARFHENLYLYGRVVWGTSDNEISPHKTYTDDFTTKRVLAILDLSGDFSGNFSDDNSAANWTIRPNISLSYMQERQQSYMNSLHVDIPYQTLSRGQIQMGPNISTRFVRSSGVVVEPSFTLDAIYSHASSRGVTITSSTGPDNGWRARAQPGLTITTPGGLRAGITGTYDGIGQSDFTSWGIGLYLSMTF